MKFTTAVLSVLLGAAAADIGAVEGSRDLASVGKCAKTGKTNATLKKLLNAYTSSIASSDSNLLEPVKCEDPHLKVFHDFTPDGPNGVCGSKYSVNEQLESCCGGMKEHNDRSITIRTDFGKQVIEQAKLSLTVELKKHRCCDRCTCWGDPHCQPFGTRDRESIKSFVACDTTTKIDKEGRECSNRLENTEDARKRCLGIDDAGEYKHNAGHCEWIGFNDDYDKTTMGGPCVPTTTTEMVIYGRTLASNDGPILSAEQSGYEIVGSLGERGVLEKVSLRIRKVKDNGVVKNSVVSLNVKESCAYPTNAKGKTLLASLNTAEKGEFENEDFKITRRLSILSTALDLKWSFEDKVNSETFTFNCKGATDRNEASASGASPTFRSILREAAAQTGISAASLDDLYQEVGKSTTAGVSTSSSTRLPKQTIFDIQVYGSTVYGDENGTGFCVKKEFEEYAQWYGTNASPYEQCNIGKNLDFQDRKVIASFPKCKKLLSLNDCGNFKDFDGIEYNKELRSKFKKYKQNLSACVEVYCAEAQLPAGVKPENCYTDFYDFGAPVTVDNYPPPTSGVETLGEGFDDTPVWQEGCVVTFTASYVVDNVRHTQEWLQDRDSDGNLVFDSNGNPVFSDMFFLIEGTPTELKVKQNSCAGVCGSRPKIDLDVSFDTVCEPNDDYDCFDLSNEQDKNKMCKKAEKVCE